MTGSLYEAAVALYFDASTDLRNKSLPDTDEEAEASSFTAFYRLKPYFGQVKSPRMTGRLH
jgi:hypothetical protein